MIAYYGINERHSRECCFQLCMLLEDGFELSSHLVFEDVVSQQMESLIWKDFFLNHLFRKIKSIFPASNHLYSSSLDKTKRTFL